MHEPSIRFSEEDLQLFAAASGDRNPLHLSDDYARQTPYGQRVVFGALGAAAALRDFEPPDDLRVGGLEADFQRPMCLDVDYRLTAARSESEYRARLFDGSIPVMSLALKLEPGARGRADSDLAPSSFERAAAAVRGEEELREGLVVSGSYMCDQDAVCRLRARWSISAEPFLVEILCCGSFIAGMELPGERALFSRLNLTLAGGAPSDAVPLRYRVRLRSFNPRTSQSRMAISLETAGATVASGDYEAFFRTPLPALEPAPQDCTDTLAGRVALVIGASRGLGAATADALAGRGATVYTLSRSAAGCPRVRAEIGDASELAVLERLRDRIAAERGRLDILVCNACPPILPLRLEPEALRRIGGYLSSAVGMTLAPICVFGNLLNAAGGTFVVVSSAAVERPVREWPHYLAAKNAVEALAGVAALQYPRTSTLVVRPDKLLTALTNTPMGRQGAKDPTLMAHRIATRLEQALQPGKVDILR